MSFLPPVEVESELSYAYIHATAASAGMACEVSHRQVDNMGVDATIRAAEQFAPDSVLTDLALDVQLKATINQQPTQNERIPYFFDGVARYDGLRRQTTAVPRILVVLFLPKSSEKWLAWTEAELAMRKCAWWVSLRGAPATENSSGQTVYLPENQHFNREGLRQIMTRLSRQEELVYAG